MRPGRRTTRSSTTSTPEPILAGEAVLLDLVIVFVAAIVPVIYAIIVFPRRDLAAPA